MFVNGENNKRERERFFDIYRTYPCIIVLFCLVFKELVSRILVAIDLHVGHMPFLGGDRLVHLDEALIMW